MSNHSIGESEFVASSGNVFADLGLPNADEELAKAELAHSIRRRIDALCLTQTEAARRLGTDQAKVSQLVRGKVSSFSLGRLIRYVNALDLDVRITIEPAGDHRTGSIVVKAG